MTPQLRKALLTTHIACSVGWLGAVAAFSALAVAGISSIDPVIARGVYIGLGVIGWVVIVPACVLSLATGIAHSLGSEWGLTRHYWIALKFLLTSGASLMLILHMQPIVKLAQAATKGLLEHHLLALQRQLVIDAGLAAIVLLSTTILSIYKPWGLTSSGRKNGFGGNDRAAKRINWGRVAIGAMALFLVSFVLLHLTGRGLHQH